MTTFLALVLTATSIVLPGGPPVGTDYTAYDPVTHRLWIPAGNTGRVDIVDVRTGTLVPIDGFATRPGKNGNLMGPSSATVAGGTVWVGSRGDNSLCSFDAVTFARGACIKLDAMPDGLAWSAPTGELWVTTPREASITIVDAAHAITKVKTPGAPEGYAIDAAHGLYFTNLEDKDLTLAIDLKTKKIVSTWAAGCGKEGPRGLVRTSSLLLVACTDGVVAHDPKDGRVLGRLTTGKGVDDVAFHDGLVYVAAGAEALLTIARVDDKGTFAVVHTAKTAPGARNAVVDQDGTAYVVSGREGKLYTVAVPTR